MNAAIREMQEGMERHGYIAEHSIATAVYLAKEMRKPLLIEGDAGVGKTGIAGPTSTPRGRSSARPLPS